jgi:GDPmannose 4,6-dehydratase
MSAKELGISLEFRGANEEEVGVVAAVAGDRARCRVGDVVVRVDPRYFRPTEVETLLGDPSKAKAKLGWEPRISTEQLCAEMVMSDYEGARRDSLVKEHGFRAYDYHE